MLTVLLRVSNIAQNRRYTIKHVLKIVKIVFANCEDDYRCKLMKNTLYNNPILYIVSKLCHFIRYVIGYFMSFF